MTYINTQKRYVYYSLDNFCPDLMDTLPTSEFQLDSKLLFRTSPHFPHKIKPSWNSSLCHVPSDSLTCPFHIHMLGLNLQILPMVYTVSETLKISVEAIRLLVCLWTRSLGWQSDTATNGTLVNSCMQNKWDLILIKIRSKCQKQAPRTNQAQS
jgi:hypothetical protein